jgi:hypothetical protein
MAETIEELPPEQGVWIAETIEASVVSGDVNYSGWAWWFDMDRLRVAQGHNYPVEFYDYEVVLVAVWPDGKMQVEAFSDPNTAGWRWLFWDDMFRPTPQPEPQDVVIQYDWDTRRFSIAGSTKLGTTKWKALEGFLQHKFRSDSRLADAQLWYYDSMIGNYYHWEL